MTSINLLHVLAPGCYHQGVFPIKGIQALHANLVRHRLHWKNYSIKSLKYIKFASIKSQRYDIKTLCLPSQLEFAVVYIFEPSLFAINTPNFSTPFFLHTYPPMKMEQTVFRNVDILNSDAGELPRRKHTMFIFCMQYV
jgi:hypothetical protein